MHLLTTATSTDEATRASGVAVLPVGSFEQHGDHLPLITDTVVARLIAQRVAVTYDLLLLPPITVSCSHEHEGFAGTASITAATLISMIDDIRDSLARTGVHKLAIVNGHGGNYVLSNITRQANTTGAHVVLFPGRDDWNLAQEHAGMQTTGRTDMHGGELETSILLHAHPELVRDSYRDADHETDDRPHLLVTGMRGYTDTGIIGRPSAATAAKGRSCARQPHHRVRRPHQDVQRLIVLGTAIASPSRSTARSRGSLSRADVAQASRRHCGHDRAPGQTSIS